MFVIAARQVQDPYVPHLCEFGACRVIQVVGALLGIAAQSLVGDHVRLVVFTRGYRNVTLGREDFYLRSSGKRLRKVVGKVVTVPESELEVGINIPVRTYARPVPVGTAGDKRRAQDEEDQKNDGASACPGCGFAPAPGPDVFSQL